MQVIKQRTEAERFRAFHQTQGYKSYNAERMRETRANALPHFIGFDGEGIGRGKHHRYVLMSSFDKNGEGEHYVAQDVSRGIQWDEAFEFLYGQFRQWPRASFVGFFLGYDFNKILATLPLKAARSLLTREGKAARKIPTKNQRRQYNAVKVGRWEVDILGMKRLSIRPRPDGCTCYEQRLKCHHKQNKWMHICDSGPFFQMSFLAVLNRDNWVQDPDGWPVSQAEYDIILEGKNRRAVARLDRKMKDYNRLENIVLCRVMERLAGGFHAVGIKIAKDQWYGPGATASKWLQMKGIPKRAQLRKGDAPLVPKWFSDICHFSYFGGWFEIFSHGLIRGTSYNYDINNAYPYAATKLPHVCGECQYHRGQGDYNGTGEYVLLSATVFSNGDRIGSVPYRTKDGSILRPRVSKGWYWRHEIDAARRAGLVKKVMVSEWAEFLPCSHPKPLTDIQQLYNLRIKVGKASAQGLAIKLNNNSIYGKFAQSVGSAPYNNWFYASYITSHCRTQILDAIATHPNKADSVLMVATDGVCFDSPHTGLLLSKKLGEWDDSEYNELVLFKPGVYWHKEGKDALIKVKSRGVPRDEFAKACEEAETLFRAFSYRQMYPDFILKTWELGDAIIQLSEAWPIFTVPVNFRMRTCKQALNEGNWEGAGEVLEAIELTQDSDPQSKRRKPFWNGEKHRIDTVIHDLPIKELQTTYHGQEKVPVLMSIGFNKDGDTALSGMLEAMATLRDKPANYDLPVGDIEWVNVWGGD